MAAGPASYGVVMSACHRAGQSERVLELLQVRISCVCVCVCLIRGRETSVRGLA